MGFVGVLGIVLSLLAFSVSNAAESRHKTVLFALMFIVHLAASTAYYSYAVSVGGSDAHMYYFDPYAMRGLSGFGTIFVVNLVQFLQEHLGGSFFDYFLLFQASGFWGIVFIAKIFDEIFNEFDVSTPIYVLLFLFLPGLHFWTGAIGKDAPLFFSIALATWSVMRLSRRFLFFGSALALMMLFRPHIALIAVAALTLALLLDTHTRLWIKVGILAAIFLGLGTVVAGVEATFLIDVTSTSSVDEFLSREVTEESGADMALVGASFPVKLLSLLLRPFFFDVADAMGYVASFENVALLSLYGYIFWNFGLALKLTRKVLYVRFSVFFFVALAILLALVNFNIGLGLRQKMMLMPPLLALLTSIIAVRRAATQDSTQRERVEPTTETGLVTG